MSTIENEQVKQQIRKMLGQNYDRAMKVFDDYGPELGLQVMNSLSHAVDQKKVGEILGILEDHFEHHLSLQHPAARGQLVDMMHQDPTKQMFLRIYKDVLHLPEHKSA